MYNKSLKVHLQDIFLLVFCSYISNLGMRIRLLSDCNILLEFAEILIIHSVVIELTWSLIPCQLSQCGVRLYAN
jgi:hypothetical protein